MGYTSYQAEKAAVNAPVSMGVAFVRFLFWIVVGLAVAVTIAAWALVRAARGDLTGRGARLAAAGAGSVGFGIGLLLLYWFAWESAWPILGGLLLVASGAVASYTGGRAARSRQPAEQPAPIGPQAVSFDLIQGLGHPAFPDAEFLHAVSEVGGRVTTAELRTIAAEFSPSCSEPSVFGGFIRPYMSGPRPKIRKDGAYRVLTPAGRVVANRWPSG